ncbi:MAG: NAD(P)H-binding protein [Pseudomonadota bacterium]|nr:NAD(P)H-binding protein [Pseudomonadota bacterium]
MVAALKLAVTGATGFVGGHLLGLAVDDGHDVRALTRRTMKPRRGVTWVDGALDRPDSLAALVEGADAVIHCAGVINARDAAGFEAGNVTGTAAILAAAEAGGIARFVHVSSLAAREPELSLYGGSKARSEALVAASPLSTATVRPPAVYGPGDRETLELFKMARGGVIVLPPAGRLSLIHVDDLARLLLSLAGSSTAHDKIFEPDDGRPGGWTYREFGLALGRAVGRKVVTISTPRAVMALAARADRLVRGDKAKLTPDRAAYFSHGDWCVGPDQDVPPSLWQPRIATEGGLADTARWYRDAGWL